MAQIVQQKRSKRARAEEQRPAEAKDPICGMAVNVASARHKASVAGVDYYFCCVGCRTKFLQRGVSA